MRDIFNLAAVFALVAVLAHSPTSLQAQVHSSSDVNNTALWQTQKLLNDHSERAAAVQASPQAQAADANVRSLMGNDERTDQVYSLSSDILGDMVSKTQGDGSQMNQILQNANQNPENFYNLLSPEQKAKIRDLASQVAPPAPVAH